MRMNSIKAPIDIKTRRPLVEQKEEEVILIPTPEAILKKCLESADTMETLLILTMDKDGELAFIGNCEGLAESVLFMDMVRMKALYSQIEPSGGGNTLA